MPDQPPSRNSAHVLRDLHSYIAEPALNIDALSEQQIEAELKRRSISPQASFRAIHELLDDHLAASELAAARQNRLTRLEAVKPTGSGEAPNIMNPSEFLASNKKLSDLTRSELNDLLNDKAITTWLYNAIANELLRRIS